MSGKLVYDSMEYSSKIRGIRMIRKTSYLLLAAAVISFSCRDMSALADLNKFEADVRGEFGIGSVDLRKAVR
nr:hypothetical protein [Tanacetum cinerariifolium]